MISVSELTGETYQDEEVVFFRNTLQSAFYVFHSAKLVDVFVDDSMHFVFVFSREDHNRLKLLWRDSCVEKDKVNCHG